MTPSTSTLRPFLAMARAISAVRGKFGLMLTSRMSVTRSDENTDSSSPVIGRTGSLNVGRSWIDPCLPMDSRPLSALRIANDPAMPPVGRTSALFWISSR